MGLPAYRAAGGGFVSRGRKGSSPGVLGLLIVVLVDKEVGG